MLLRRPDGPVRKCTLVVPPFAEEMNKSRQLITRYSQHCCARGEALLCVDLFGTGDSEGEFVDACLGRWLEDLEAAAEWSASIGCPVSSLLGIRFGAILAARLASRSRCAFDGMTFWQPVTSGARYMDQFLRMRAMSSRLSHGGDETVSGLRRQLEEEGSLEVGGYALGWSLCKEIDGLELRTELTQGGAPINWIEVAAEPPVPGISPPQVEKLRSAGHLVKYTVIEGEPFWAASELVLIPELICAS